MPDNDATEFAALCAEAAQAVADGCISIADAADRLQDRALYTGLIEAVGQDEVQRLMSEAFPPVEDIPADYASQLVMQWELGDPRDRWRWTGEMPPKPEPLPQWPERRLYTTSESTVAAFWMALGRGNSDYLADWLLQHPRDAQYLHELWGKKCSTAA